MPRESSLRVVKAGEPRRRAAAKRKQPTVLEAVESGDYLTELRASLRRIASAVDDPNTPARDLAALTRRQLEISREIRAITSRDEGDEVGEAAATPDEEWAVT